MQQASETSGDVYTPVVIQAREWRESPRVSSVTHPPITSPRPGEATVTVGAAQRIGTTSSSGLLRPHSDCAVSQPEIMPRWGKRSSCRTRNSTTGRGRGILLARCGNSFTSTGSDDDVGAVPPDVVDHDLGVLRGGRTGSNQQIASSTDGCLPVGGRCLQPNCRHGKDVSQVDHSRILRRRRNETVQCTAAPIPDTGGYSPLLDQAVTCSHSLRRSSIVRMACWAASME